MNNSRRAWSAVLLLILVCLAAACNRLPAPAADPGVDFGDPDVGGGAGQDTGPQTPIPPATATGEASPRLDETAAAAFPTAEPTAEPTADEATPVAQPPTAAAATTPPEPSLAPEVSPTTEPPTATPETTAPATSPSPTAQTNSAGETESSAETIHVVQAGENLYRIGLKYGLSWVVIAAFNGITDPNAITVGQELRIPPLPTATPATQSSRPATGDQPPPAASLAPADGADTAVSSPPSAVVVVAPGDTLYNLAQRHGLTWDPVSYTHLDVYKRQV